MAIKHVILHEVTRENDGDIVVKNLRDKVNSIEGLGVKLTNQLTELFTQATMNIGEFGVNGDTDLEPAFEQQLKKLHHNKELTAEEAFIQTTRKMAASFADIISEPKLQTVKGGILAFYEYEHRGSEMFAVAVLNRIEGINASEELDLTLATIIDLKQLHLGSAINLTDWEEGLTTRYIKFKVGRSAEMRDYFENFIGCQRDKHAAARETTALKSAIKVYSAELDLSDEATQLKVDSAYEFIQSQQKKGKEIELTHIANAVFPDSAPNFLAIARNEVHQLSEQIAISPAELKRFVRVSGSGKGISISFDNELFGKTITYDNDKLIFTVIPDSLKSSILELQRKVPDNNDD